jgi:hypothetical protein
MSPVPLAPTLQVLDKEIFFAVLDVALDINNELLVGNPTTDTDFIYIEGTRTLVRYPVLYPGQSVGAMYRYVELRKKGLQFLQKHNYILNFEFHKLGMAGFEGRFAIDVGDPALFPMLLTELRLEENRRYPAGKIQNDISTASARLLQLADSFHGVVLRLRSRRMERQPLLVEDEYDVQYLFGALLEVQFGDVRPEEWGPRHAGSASRVDFLLKNESVVVETKMTRAGLTDKKLGDELILDIARYKQRQDCKSLMCFVYDPNHRLTHPQALETDLSTPSDHLDVRVLIRPNSR